MMKKRVCLWLCIMSVLLTIAWPKETLAAPTVNVNQPCSLNIYYTKEGKAFSDLEIRIYRVAKYFASGSYSFITPFDQYPVQLNNLTSQKELREATFTLASYIEADGLAPTLESETDSNGKVALKNLKTGVYLLMGVDAPIENGKVEFDPMLIFLPTLENGREYVYDYDVKVKGREIIDTPDDPEDPKDPEDPEPPKTPDKKYKYKVVKLWKDSGNGHQRPDNVEIAILRNRKLYKTAMLNEENNWSYFWKTDDFDDRWTVTEKNVPDGYLVTISKNGRTFNIVNEYSQVIEVSPEEVPKGLPKTGDSNDLLNRILTISLSVTGICVLWVYKKRNNG